EVVAGAEAVQSGNAVDEVANEIAFTSERVKSVYMYLLSKYPVNAQQAIVINYRDTGLLSDLASELEMNTFELSKILMSEKKLFTGNENE
ncbi:hypothetical protein ABT56_18745, partial [Photobacterium aquae]